MEIKSSLLKPAIKKNSIKKRNSLLDNFQLGDTAVDRYNSQFLQDLPALKQINYIKPTKASQLIYMKNKKLEPLHQIELITNKAEKRKINYLKSRRQSTKDLKKIIDFSKMTEALSPLKKGKSSGKLNINQNMSSHIVNLDMDLSILKNQKNLNPLINNNNIDTILIENSISIDDYYLEKYVNMMNIDNEVFYLGSSFLNVFLECMHEYHINKKHKVFGTEHSTASSKNLSNFSLNCRFSHHYSNKNLTNLSKLSTDSNQIQQTLQKISQFISDSKISINSKNDEEKGFVSVFGVHFPKFTIERLKENILSFKYLHGKYKFFRVSMKNNLKVEMDVGFIEIEMNNKQKYIEIHKLYIIRVYRKMQIYQLLLESVIKEIEKIDSNLKKIFIKIIDRFENYKALLGKLGFRLKEKIRIKDEDIAYLVYNKK